MERSLLVVLCFTKSRFFLQRQEDNVKRELSFLQKTKVELEQHIDQLIKEKEQFRKKLEESKGLKSEEAKVILKRII